MNDLQVIQTLLAKAARRQRWQRGWRGFWQGLFIGAVAWLVALGIHKLLPLPLAFLAVSAVIALACAPIGFLAGWRRAPSVAEMARWVDQREHLQERLSTALELSRAPANQEWQALLASDAARFVRELEPRRLLPFHLPSVSRWALLALVVGAGLGFVPEYRSTSYVQKQREDENLRDTGRMLAEITRRSLESRPPVLPATQSAMENVAELSERLQGGKLTRAEALRELASVTDKVKDQARQLSNDPAIRRMEKAARTPAGSSGQTPEAIQKQMEALEQALGKNAADPAKLDRLKNDLQKLKQAAADLANKTGEEDEAAQQKLAEAMAELGRQAQEMGLQLPGLEEAMEALAAGQADMFLKDLDLALLDLEKLSEMAKSLKQLKDLLKQIGKDLAEQLELGQAGFAILNLRKMIQTLQSAAVSPEQVQKIREEVSKAMPAAGPYGSVAEYLERAVKQMQAGQNLAAAASLAEAARELERLLEQAGECDSLAGMIDALRRAQMCISACQSWGQCRNPGFGPGSRPGRGVGTWPDEEGWLGMPEMTELWDNSGIEMPELDPRGLTDRGEGEVPKDVQSTRVRGQFSPGGSMPSITLKGVSITGQSSVAYEEAVAAAQSEAESALSQEKVPRAYQGTVRDYFDDLKK